MYAPETLITSNKLFQLWHIDPKGDSGPPCHEAGDWRLHVRHWHFNLPVWIFTFRAKHTRKCYVCGRRGHKRNPVNLLDGRGQKHIGGCVYQSPPKN